MTDFACLFFSGLEERWDEELGVAASVQMPKSQGSSIKPGSMMSTTDKDET